MNRAMTAMPIFQSIQFLHNENKENTNFQKWYNTFIFRMENWYGFICFYLDWCLCGKHLHIINFMYTYGHNLPSMAFWFFASEMVTWYTYILFWQIMKNICLVYRILNEQYYSNEKHEAWSMKCILPIWGKTTYLSRKFDISLVMGQ